MCIEHLIPFVFEAQDSDIGMLAREGILAVGVHSNTLCGLRRFLVGSSSLIPVLAAGLGAKYSSLQTSLDSTKPSMKQLNNHMYDEFISSVDFINAVGSKCHPDLYIELHMHVVTGFLRPVIRPALGVTDSGDNQIVGIGYLEAIVSHCHTKELIDYDDLLQEGMCVLVGIGYLEAIVSHCHTKELIDYDDLLQEEHSESADDVAYFDLILSDSHAQLWCRGDSKPFTAEKVQDH
ncbi:hypothetical protein SARC_11312 [Sphaeroforma arctica JP610]|uniref:Uncharacterized protein n=1 Tax=Sphaeroforma arctica JP610 TaxID=667725 RepID=A0A0L0FJH9_9EUKA|nr:hypothetical protein SARC_11312 [Sphaeroforma arctica JP610]KNC76178.1 hypothetical protein SARC_11312 [Sphaeroforma arctica JP610]|eukprot:XP_014150080.1 hypothetical protein SARC_11312 [Sphaeroforma arctica JP610]